MAWKTRKIIVKRGGRFFKAIYVSRSKAVVVVQTPGTLSHHTFPLKDGRYHATLPRLSDDDAKKLLEEIESQTEIEGSPIEQTVVDNTPRVYIWQKSDWSKGISLGTFAGYPEECKKLKSDYEIVDLDVACCETSNIFVSLFPKEVEILRPRGSFLVKEIKVDFGDVVVLVEIVDAPKYIAYMKPFNEKHEKAPLVKC